MGASGWTTFASGGVGYQALGPARMQMTSASSVEWSTNSIFGSSDLYLTRYAAKQLMISGDGVGATTNAGAIIGYTGTSSWGGVWSTEAATRTLSTANFAWSSANTLIGAPASGAISIVRPGSTTDVLAIASTAGSGPTITAGTAASAVSALSLTQTVNYASAALDSVLWTITDTSSHANTNLFRILGTSTGAVELFKVAKNGTVTIGPNSGTKGAMTIDTSADYQTILYPNYGGSLGAGFFVLAGTDTVFAGSTSSPQNNNYVSIGRAKINYGTGGGSSYTAIFKVGDVAGGWDVAANPFTLTGSNAYASASTNLVGGAITIKAGNGASGSAGNAHGGNLTLSGGDKYGTGHAGYIVMQNMPTSSAGLPSGAIWANSNVLTIVP